jgi:hypothetical protein
VLLTHPQQAIAFAGYAAGFSLYSQLRTSGSTPPICEPEETRSPSTTASLPRRLPPSTSCEPEPHSRTPGRRRLSADVVGEYEKATPIVQASCWSMLPPFPPATRTSPRSARS